MFRRGQRGAWRGDRSFRGRRSAQRDEPQVPPALGSVFRTITLGELSNKIEDSQAAISNCKFVTSYNLTDHSTIIVPGRPPLWTPMPARKLQLDSGHPYRDVNSAIFPDHSLDPVFMSIFSITPAFDAKSIDIAACGSTLGNLLRFVRGQGEPFSFTVQVVGQTVLFVRRNTHPSEVIKGVHGFGHSFIEENTTWGEDMEGSVSYQRIISYELGTKRIIVRFEVDGHVMDQTDFDEDNDKRDSTKKDSVGLLGFSETGLGNIIVAKKGSMIEQSSILDIKTRSVRKQRQDVIAEQMPRWWLRQFDNTVLSFHNNGVFEPPTVENISSLREQWQTDNKDDITRLVNIIDKISEEALTDKQRMFEVRYADGALHLHEIPSEEYSRWNAVSDDLQERWAQS